jgi:hypothetical protein
VHELGAERNRQLEQFRVTALAAQAGHGDEAVEVRRPCARDVVVDAVPAAEKARHDRLGDAGREGGGDSGVRGGAAVGQDLGAGGGGRGMSGGNCLHSPIFAPSLAFPLVSGGWRLLLIVAGALAAVILFVVLRSDEEPTTAPPPGPTEVTISVNEPPPPPPVEKPVNVILETGGSDIVRRTIDRGDRVVLTILGSRGEEIHLHGYDRTVVIPARGRARLAFRATIPGRFEVEVEGSHTQIADLTVR